MITAFELPLTVDEAIFRQSIEPMLNILVERKAQDEQWGGAAHDDLHAPVDWIDFIETQLEKLCYAATDGHRPIPPLYDTALVRSCLVKIGALCVAGIGSIDRRSAATSASQTEGTTNV